MALLAYQVAQAVVNGEVGEADLFKACRVHSMGARTMRHHPHDSTPCMAHADTNPTTATTGMATSHPAVRSNQQPLYTEPTFES